MHVKSLSRGLDVDLVKPRLELGTSILKAKCLPQDHDVTKVVVAVLLVVVLVVAAVVVVVVVVVVIRR